MGGAGIYFENDEKFTFDCKGKAIEIVTMNGLKLFINNFIRNSMIGVGAMAFCYGAYKGRKSMFNINMRYQCNKYEKIGNCFIEGAVHATPVLAMYFMFKGVQ